MDLSYLTHAAHDIFIPFIVYLNDFLIYIFVLMSSPVHKDVAYNLLIVLPGPLLLSLPPPPGYFQPSTHIQFWFYHRIVPGLMKQNEKNASNTFSGAWSFFFPLTLMADCILI